ncbi:hypothetical protein Tco_0935458 [Tanacetum coccineum]
MTKTKSFNKNTKYKALYHDLMESILKDEDAIDKVVVDRLKKRNPDDADRDEGPPARPDQGLKRKKTGKDTKPSKKGKSTGTSKGTTNSQPKSTSKSAQVDETVFKAEDTQEIKVRRSDQHIYKFMEGDFPRLHVNDIEDMLILVVQNRLFNLKGEDIVHLAVTLRMFTRRIVIQKRVEDLQLGVESYKKKLNILRPLTHKAGINDIEPYTTYSNPQGFIYLDKLERNKLMCSHELYKFSDGTLISVWDKLKDMLNNLEMGYTSVMPRRRWSNLDKKRYRVMVKDNDRQLLEIRLMRGLKKFVGGREYEEDLRLLQRTI